MLAPVPVLFRGAVRRVCTERYKLTKVSVTMHELDSTLIGRLRETLSECRQDCEQSGIAFSATVFNEDFISGGADGSWRPL
jgi:hypothetical protein